MEDDATNAMAELSQAMAADILSLPELSESDWSSYALVAEVSDDRDAIAAYLYTASGEAEPAEPPEDEGDLYFELRDRMRGPDGATWDVVVVKIDRGSGGLALDFFAGVDADPYRINPQNIERLPELIRPRAEDFQDG